MPTYLVGDTLSVLDGARIAIPNSGFIKTDSLIFNDYSSFLLSNLVIANDSILFLDTVGILKQATLTDSISISDAVVAIKYSSNFNILSDTLTLSDAIVNSLNPPYALSDTISLSDAVAVSLPNILSVQIFSSDIIPFSDALSLVLKGSSAILVEQLKLQDNVMVILGSTQSAYLRRYLNDVC